MSGLVSSKGIVSQQPASDAAYAASWNGDLTPPSKNAVYDKIETLSAGSDSRVDNVEYNLGVNSLRDAVNGGYAYFNMVGGVGDVYTDETGIDTGAAINETYDAAVNYYAPTQSDSADLLLHCDGSDGSTSFPDATSTHTFTAVGDAQVDTAQSQFGGASLLTDGTGDYIYTASSADFNFGSGDFTIDCWIRPNSVTGFQYIVGRYSSSAPNNTGVGMLMNGTNIRYFWALDGVGSFTFADTTSAGLSIGVWAHIAYVRSGDTLTVYIDGVSRGTTALAASQAMYDSTLALSIGTAAHEAPGSSYNGHIDEVRIIKGTAVWTTGFTPPTSAYALTKFNMTLPSIDFASGLASVSNVRTVMLYEPIDATTLNTDLILEVSRDSGTTWTAATLESDAAFSGAVIILVADEVSVTGQPAGTTVRYRVRTLNDKNIRIHGVFLQWR